MKGIKRMRIKRERINASDAIDHLIRKSNAQLSILSASNVIKPIIEDLCAASKRKIKMILKRDHLDETIKRMTSLQRLY